VDAAVLVAEVRRDKPALRIIVSVIPGLEVAEGALVRFDANLTDESREGRQEAVRKLLRVAIQDGCAHGPHDSP
jgi:hypothetical protein